MGLLDANAFCQRSSGNHSRFNGGKSLVVGFQPWTVGSLINQLACQPTVVANQRTCSVNQSAAGPHGVVQVVSEYVCCHRQRYVNLHLEPGWFRLSDKGGAIRRHLPEIPMPSQTGEAIKIKAKTTAKFYVAKAVKDAIAPVKAAAAKK